MKKKKNENIEVTVPSQQALENILRTEVKIAQEISEAKELAEKAINSAREETVHLKEKIIEQARQDRERMLAEGLEAANTKAHEDLEIARIKSNKFFEMGQNYIDSAVSRVIEIILDHKGGER